MNTVADATTYLTGFVFFLLAMCYKVVVICTHEPFVVFRFICEYIYLFGLSHILASLAC
jgi:hypothetical protein